VAVGDGLGTPALRLRFLACRYPLWMEFSLFGLGLMAVSVLISVSDNISLWFMMGKPMITRPE
jgi:hypothetical protein